MIGAKLREQLADFRSQLEDDDEEDSQEGKTSPLAGFADYLRNLDPIRYDSTRFGSDDKTGDIVFHWKTYTGEETLIEATNSLQQTARLNDSEHEDLVSCEWPIGKDGSRQPTLTDTIRAVLMLDGGVSLPHIFNRIKSHPTK